MVTSNSLLLRYFIIELPAIGHGQANSPHLTMWYICTADKLKKKKLHLFAECVFNRNVPHNATSYFNWIILVSISSFFFFLFFFPDQW